MHIPLNEQEKLKVHKMDVEPLAKFIFCYLKETLGSDPDQSEFYSTVFSLRDNLFPEAYRLSNFCGRAQAIRSNQFTSKTGVSGKDSPIFAVFQAVGGFFRLSHICWQGVKG